MPREELKFTVLKIETWDLFRGGEGDKSILNTKVSSLFRSCFKTSQVTYECALVKLVCFLTRHITAH